MEDAYAKLINLTDKLQRTQGLQLQKSKTRIMSSSEFISTSPIKSESSTSEKTPEGDEEQDVQEKSRSLLGFSLRFDPYSANAESEYEQLKADIKRFDIMSLIQGELGKSRLHLALSRKIVSAIRYLDPPQKEQTILSLIENINLIYPIFPSVMLAIKASFDDLSDSTKSMINSKIIELINNKSHIIKIDLNLSYAIRVLSCKQSAAAQEIMVRIYNSPSISSFIRRDIILVMARWNVWHWISERRTGFRSMSPPERRAFIMASYSLRDEGSHWRKHTANELSPIEKLVKDWTSKKVQRPDWVIPL